MIKRVFPTLCALLFFLSVVQPVHALDIIDNNPDNTATPTASPTASPTSFPTATPTSTPTLSPSPSATVTSAPTKSPTPKPVVVAKKTTPTPTATVSPSPTSSLMPTVQPSASAEVKGATDNKNAGGPGILTGIFFFVVMVLLAGCGVFLLRKNPKVPVVKK